MGIDEVMARAIFLDRDGVLNHTTVRDGRPYPPHSLESLRLIEGVAAALLRLRGAGFLLIAVTNQPDVARGTTSRETVEQIHSRLMQQLALDEIITCYHDGDACECRKPKPGALLEAAQRYGLDLRQSYMIGDRWKDIEAGQRAGCTCLFIDYGYRERQPVPPFVTVSGLAAAADWILTNDDRQLFARVRR
jgi:D-glycero-D-manno-heptose 1,7-bisphosphate phosphatase